MNPHWITAHSYADRPMFPNLPAEHSLSSKTQKSKFSSNTSQILPVSTSPIISPLENYEDFLKDSDFYTGIGSTATYPEYIYDTFDQVVLHT